MLINLVVSKISLQGASLSPLSEKMTSLLGMSIRQPSTSPGRHAGMSLMGDGRALYHTSLRHPSYDSENRSSPIPKPSC